MTLTKEIKSKIKEHSLIEMPNECCGLIVKNKSTSLVEVHQCKNQSTSKSTGFSLSPRDYLKASKTGKILAVYHSHPNDSEGFSPIDKINSKNHNINYLLYCVGKDKFLEYFPETPQEEYTGRSFKKDGNNCITIFREFYKKEVGYDIPKKFNWKTIHENFKPVLKGEAVTSEALAFAKSIGFEKIEVNSVEDLERNDGIVLYSKEHDFVAHVLIYLGNGKVLYQPRDAKSQIRDYGKAFLKDTVCVFRKIK